MAYNGGFKTDEIMSDFVNQSNTFAKAPAYPTEESQPEASTPVPVPMRLEQTP